MQGGTPYQLGLKVTANRLVVADYLSQDEQDVFELWFVDIGNHPQREWIIRFGINGLIHLLREANYHLADVETYHAYQPLAWQEHSATHRSLNMAQVLNAEAHD